MNRKKLIKLAEKIANTEYHYYYDGCYNFKTIFEEALKNERRRLLNCHDGYFDKSAEASNRRIMQDIERLKKKRGW